ncbi:hypothetical protein J437_LFUL008797 [Ladona fulva]|uniref:Peptidoglycan-recognition protein n=1 Tax=Ladona fulva TaxID=123851 RepID=A0A8K0K940_LADFU|nr:hypothetical protein J437_LFUL008797 [Ladona fulva]
MKVSAPNNSFKMLYNAMAATLKTVYMLSAVLALNDSEMVDNSVAVQSTITPSFPIVSRSEWGAKPPKSPPEQMHEVPVPFVLIHHTYIPGYCNSTEACKEAMREMQRFHQDDRGWNDIGYSFCIGCNGITMEGRGWDSRGAHAPGYNERSIGICLIGDFRGGCTNTLPTVLPDDGMLNAVQGLINYGIDIGKISANYTLMGHRQVRNTECPGDALFNLIQHWAHFGDPENKKHPV